MAAGLGGPVLIIAIVAALAGPAPKARHNSLTALSAVCAAAMMAACMVMLTKGQEGPWLLLSSGGGCLLMSFTMWLSRGENPGWGGEDDPDQNDPWPNEPQDEIDWDEFQRKLEEERRPQVFS